MTTQYSVKYLTLPASSQISQSADTQHVAANFGSMYLALRIQWSWLIKAVVATFKFFQTNDGIGRLRYVFGWIYSFCFYSKW